MSVGTVIYKIYLASRPDGVRYVGCTKVEPWIRVRCRYHPIRKVGRFFDVVPVEALSITVLAMTLDRAKAGDLETQMIAEYNTAGPMGANKARRSGYPKNEPNRPPRRKRR